MKHKLLIRPSAVALTIALASMGLYACGQNNQAATNTQTTTADASAPALPLTTGAATAPVYAPAVTALPAAPRPKIVRVASQADQYAYVDQASSMGSALGNAPPDYGFDYDGVRPWVWRTHSNATRLIEPISGGYRYYYYQPGASYPYLIRDPQYSYGFNDGQLVVVYDARGQVLPPQYMDQQADYAGRYLARARELYNASLQSQRRSVIAANWAARRAAIDQQQAEWNQQQSQYSAWQQYHQEHEAEQQAYWQGERDQRAAAATQFDQWHDHDYQGPPPPPAYGPVVGAAGAAIVGGAIGGYLAGRDHHHDDRGPPPPQGGPGGPGEYPQQNDGRGPGPDHGPGSNGAEMNRGQGLARSPGGPQQEQAAAVAQARQQQAQADTAHQAQLDQQAKAASAAREQAMAQGRSQQAAADAARQAEAQHQSAAIADARRQQAQADARSQEQAHAQAAVQAHQAQEAAHAQAAQVHQQQAAQVAAQKQAVAASAAAAHQPHPAGAHPDGPHPEGAHPPGEHPHRPGEGPPPAQN